VSLSQHQQIPLGSVIYHHPFSPQLSPSGSRFTVDRHNAKQAPGDHLIDTKITERDMQVKRYDFAI
jgi:hypothetical protein